MRFFAAGGFTVESERERESCVLQLLSQGFESKDRL